MTQGSLFAGIGGFDLGFERAGFETRWQVEIEPFCQAVLKTRFPNAQRLSDIQECGARNLERVDCITAGVPCQDVSVAGKRAGLAGERTGLFYEFARILRELRPAWFVFENVPGLLSSNRGRDFAEVLRVLMVDCGYGVCWRVLDSQFFGVAQRRHRVFIVGSLGRSCPAEILFESASGKRDFEKGGETGKDIAHAIARGAVGSGYRYDPNGEDFVIAATLTEHFPGESNKWAGANEADNLVATLNSGGNDGGFRTEPGERLVVGALAPNTGPRGHDAGNFQSNQAVDAGHIVIQDVRGHRDKKQRGIGISEGGPSYTLSETERHAVAFSENQRGEVVTGEIAHQLTSGGGKPGQGYPAVACSPPDADGVRDFAGLPEGLDSSRYRALGNAVTVQVAHWIARRIIQNSGQPCLTSK